MTSPFVTRDRLRRMALAHPADRYRQPLDFPNSIWRSMGLPQPRLESFFGGNASRLLSESGLPPAS